MTDWINIVNVLKSAFYTSDKDIKPLTLIRLPSYLRQTTRMYFRSRDNDGGHTIRSAMDKNPMRHANVTSVSFAEGKLLRIEVVHCGNREFRVFHCCDLDLDSMTLVNELDLHPLERYRMCENERSHLITYILPTDRQTDRQMPPNLLPLRFACGKIYIVVGSVAWPPIPSWPDLSPLDQAHVRPNRFTKSWVGHQSGLG